MILITLITNRNFNKYNLFELIIATPIEYYHVLWYLSEYLLIGQAGDLASMRPDSSVFPDQTRTNRKINIDVQGLELFESSSVTEPKIANLIVNIYAGR